MIGAIPTQERARKQKAAASHILSCLFGFPRNSEFESAARHLDLTQRASTTALWQQLVRGAPEWLETVLADCEARPEICSGVRAVFQRAWGVFGHALEDLHVIITLTNATLDRLCASACASVLQVDGALVFVVHMDMALLKSHAAVAQAALSRSRGATVTGTGRDRDFCGSYERFRWADRREDARSPKSMRSWVEAVSDRAPDTGTDSSVRFGADCHSGSQSRRSRFSRFRPPSADLLDEGASEGSRFNFDFAYDAPYNGTESRRSNPIVRFDEDCDMGDFESNFAYSVDAFQRAQFHFKSLSGQQPAQKPKVPWMNSRAFASSKQHIPATQGSLRQFSTPQDTKTAALERSLSASPLSPLMTRNLEAFLTSYNAQ